LIHRALLLITAAMLFVLGALFTFVSLGVALFIGLLVGVFFLAFVHNLSSSAVGKPVERADT
jgi:hypothetical protein